MPLLKAVFLHGIQDLQLIVVRVFVDLLKALRKRGFGFFSKRSYFR